MSQPPKFILEANCSCECDGCKSKIQKGVRKFQKHIEATYGLSRSKYNPISRAVEILQDDVDASKIGELKELLQKFIKREFSNDCTFCGCFWMSKKKTSTGSQAQLNDHLKNLSINNNNANNVNNNSVQDVVNDQTEANQQQQQEQQQQHPDANRKGKGKMGEDGKGSKRGKEIKLGGRSENMNRKGESSQKGQNPIDQTMNESNQIGQASQYSRDEIAGHDQNNQRDQNPRGQTETPYGQTYYTNTHPMSQMEQMRGGYYQQPTTVAQISPFSDEPTAEGCSIM